MGRLIKENNIKVRQPLSKATYTYSQQLNPGIESIIASELNVKKVEYQKSSKFEPEVTLDRKITHDLKEEGDARDLIRQIQQLRKESNLTLADKTKVISPSWPKAFEQLILKNTASVSISKGNSLQISKLK